MTIILNKNSKPEEIKHVISLVNSKKTKGFNAKKFSGFLKTSGDIVKMQKQIRNEWR